MRPIIDTDRLDEVEREIGMPCEQLLTPRQGSPRGRLVREGARFAVDNGAFGRFDARRFESLIAKLLPFRDLCRFVAVPDVIAAGRHGEPVGNAALTLDLFHARKTLFPYLAGWPLAYVAQDGAEALPVPWHSIRALFVGGSTAWKDGPRAAALVKAATMRGIWVHVGRINDPGRWEHFEGLGADSCDGSGLARTTRQRVAIRDRHSPAPLFTAPILVAP